MNETGARALLGLALLGACEPLLAAAARAPPRPAHGARRELAAIANDPACELASLSVLAIRKGRQVYEGSSAGAGSATAARPAGEPGHPVPDRLDLEDDDHLGLMRLVEAGKLGLDADVSALPRLQPAQSALSPSAPSPAHLLTHTSSLRDDAGYSFPPARAERVPDPGRAPVRRRRCGRAMPAPGDYFTYCNLGWGVIGTLMEGHGRTLRPPDEAPAAAAARPARPATTRPNCSPRPWPTWPRCTASAPPTPKSGMRPAPGSPRSTTTAASAGAAARHRALRHRRQRHALQPDRRPAHLGARHGHRDADADERRRARRARILKPATLERMFTRQWTADGKQRRHPERLVQLLGPGQCSSSRTSRGRRLVEGGFDASATWATPTACARCSCSTWQRKNGMIAWSAAPRSDPACKRPLFGAGALRGTHPDELHRRAIAG
jgi:hypothetical protein